MTGPYNYSSPGLPFPSAPHPTPSSASPFNLTKPKPQRPPIHNPYDKFTQPEFDAWISGITGALRRALGEHDEPPHSLPSSQDCGVEHNAYNEVVDEREVSEEVEDSFAELNTRREKGKGKARDPREGPGLSIGGKDQPIEIGSDSNEEEAEEDGDGDGDSEEDLQQRSDEEEDGEEEEYEFTWRTSGGHVHVDSQYEGSEVEEDEEDQMAMSRESPEVIELLSDEEGVVEEWDEGARPADNDESEGEYSDEEDATSQLIAQPHVRVNGDMKYSLDKTNPTPPYPAEQPEDDDTAFPPYPSHAYAQQPVEIRDPWRGPKTYAEDFYSGGDVRGGHLTVDHLAADDIEMFLTPGFVTPAEIEQEEGARRGDGHEVTNTEKREKEKEIIDIDLDGDEEDEEKEAERGQDSKDDILPASSPLASSPLDEAQPHQPVNRDEDVLDLDDLYDDTELESFGQIQGEIRQSETCNHQDRRSFPPFGRLVNFTTWKIIGEARDSEEEVSLDSEVKRVDDKCGDGDDEVDEDVVTLPLGTSDLDITATGVDGREDDEAVEESANTDDVEVGYVHGSPAANVAARTLDLVTQPETTTIAVEEMPIAVSQVPIDPSLLQVDPPRPEQHPQPETESEAELQQKNNFGLLPTPPTESDPKLEPALPGQQEMADILTSLSQYESEETAPEFEEPSGIVDMQGLSDSTYTVIEAETDDKNADIVPDEDVYAVSVTDDPIGEVVDDYEIEEPLTETEGRLTEEPERGSSLQAVSVDGGVADAPTNNLPVDADDNSIQNGEEPTDYGSENVEDNTVEAAAVDKGIQGNDHPRDSLAITAPVTTRVEESEIVSDPARPHASGVDTIATGHQVDSQTCSERTNTSLLRAGFPMPILADPTVPDPTSRPSTPTHTLTLSILGTPVSLPSPAGTPGSGRPTPIPVPIPAPTLKALQVEQSQSRTTTSGLFTPGAATASGPRTPVEGLSSLQGEDDVASLQRAGEHEAQGQTEELSMNGREDYASSQVEASSPVLDSIGMYSSPSALAAEVAVEYPKLSPAYMSPTASYPMRVVMTRKPTDPILYSDPYPYSLSTPGSDFLDPTKDGHDELSEEENEHDNSISSSSTTLEKELESKSTANHLRDLSHDNVEDDGVDLELRYPSDSDTRNEGSTRKSVTDFVVPHITKPVAERGLDTGEDTDADGIVDPDFADPDISTSDAPHQQPDIDVQAEEDPFKLMGNDSTVAPGAVEDDGSSGDDQNEAEMVHYRLPDNELSHPDIESPSVQNGIGAVSRTGSPITFSETATTPQSTGTLLPANANGGKAVSNEVNGSERLMDRLTPEASSSRSSKRKRNSTAHLPSRLTRSMSSKTQMKHNVPPRLEGKNKGRDKNKHTKMNSIDSAASEQTVDNLGDNQSSSGASTASRMLRPSSQNTSRASSILSSASSDKSSSKSQPSPTLLKQNIGVKRIQPPPPLFHTHSHSHTIPHHHHPPPSSMAQQQLQRQVQRVPSLARPNGGTIVLGSNPSQSGPSQRVAPVSSSPVTRSNCRYHKISLPREEGGPRVCFLVPGCSLGDRDLMVEEEIVDHGDATVEDSARIVRDIESLDFTPYLIGILRQLVGVDLLREQEIYYLPQPWDGHVRKPRHRKPEKLLVRLPSRDSAVVAEPAGAFGSPCTSSGSTRSPTSSRAPASAAGSTSTSLSLMRKGRGSERGSFSTVSHSDSGSSEEDGSPKSKRSRPSPSEENGSAGKMTSVSESRLNNPLKTRRSRRLGQDASAYQPDTDVEVDSTDEEPKTPRARRKRARRGIKRTRTNEVTAGDEDTEVRKTKRVRLQLHLSGSGQHA